MRPAWVRRGRDQLIRQFADPAGNAAWIGIASLDGFGGGPANGLYRAGGRFTIMPGLPIDKGFIWMPDQSGDQPELWLAPDHAGYRDTFERFAQRYLGAAGLAGADVQIDHVFPKKAGALGDLAYVRMLAIPPESNMAAGRTLERAMAARNRLHGARAKVTRLATYFSIGKATGFTAYAAVPDSGKPSPALAAALIAYLRGQGVPTSILTALDQKLLATTAQKIR